jgi:hypothetical protein
VLGLQPQLDNMFMTLVVGTTHQLMMEKLLLGGIDYNKLGIDVYQ